MKSYLCGVPALTSLSAFLKALGWTSGDRAVAMPALNSLPILFWILLLTWGLGWSQSATSTLIVRVQDESSRVVPGVRILLVNESTGLARHGTTGSSGTLGLPLLKAGNYTVTASLEGFRTEVIEQVHLAVGLKSALDIRLVPGGPDESVVVTASRELLRPVNATFGEVLDNRTIMAMPLNGRQFLELALLSPGSAPPAPGSELASQNSSGINVNGARESSNNFLLDGVDNNDLYLNRFVINPSIDAIQEFTISSNNFDAEYGRSAGSQVNVALKSGGRQLHGSVYEFFRHSGMDARNFFDTSGEEAALLRQSQFGGSLGGPIGQSGNFFFINAEALRGRRAETRTSSVPSVLEKQGDFGLRTNPIRDPFSGEPFDQNRIPAGRIDSVGALVAGLYPDPNAEMATRNLVTSPVGTARSIQFTVKTDHQISEKTALFMRYSLGDDLRKIPFSDGGPNFSGFGTNVLDRGQNFAVGTTRIVSSRTLNEFRFGYNRLRRDVLAQNSDLDGFSALGMQGPSLDALEQGYPSFVVSGYQRLGDDPNLPTVRRTGHTHFSDVVSLQRGRHHLKLGGEIRRYQETGFTRLFPRGQVIFTGAFTGDALADVLLGLPSLSLLGINNNDQSLHNWAFNGFVQDDWHISSTLTLNLGLRYEYNRAPVDSQDRLTIFDPGSQTLLPVGQGGVPRAGVDADLNNFGPRLGLAWDPSGSGKLVIRSGYGVFYDTGTLIENSSMYFNPPLFNLNLFSGFAGPLTLGQAFPTELGFALPPSPITLDRHFRTAYSQHWSLGLSGEVGGDVVLEARYVGTRGTKLVSKRNLNQPVPGEEPLFARRPISGFDNILFIESAGSSSYHALQLRTHKRLSRGLSFLGAYTYSKSIDNASSFLGSDGYNNTPQDSRDLAAEKALSSFDLRHRVSWSLLYALPSPMNRSFFRGWQLSTLIAVQSGRPLTPILELDNSNTGNIGGIFGYDRPNLVGNHQLSSRDPDRYFDASAFAAADPFHFGNTGRNIIVGPGYASLDTALSKQFSVGQEHKIQIRAEVFNGLNRANFRLPEGFVGRPTFGKILSASPGRELQLSLRYSF